MVILVLHPEHLFDGVRCGHIFCFSCGEGDGCLFLTLPGDGVRAELEDPFCYRSSILFVIRIITVRPALDVKRAFSEVFHRVLVGLFTCLLTLLTAKAMSGLVVFVRLFDVERDEERCVKISIRNDVMVSTEEYVSS